MTARIILLAISASTLFVIYKMLTRLSSVGKGESGNAGERLYVCAIAGMFSAWLLYWLYRVVTAATPGKLNPVAGILFDVAMVPVGIVGIVAGVLVGLLARKWK